MKLVLLLTALTTASLLTAAGGTPTATYVGHDKVANAIAKGGKIISVAAGCDTSGLLANTLSEKVAKAVNTDAVDVQQKVKEEKAKK